MFTHSPHELRSPHDLKLPEGPDEMLGLTEGSRTWVGVLLVVATLGFLVWTGVILGLS